MYSTLLDDQEYEPLLIVYLTTTGALLQNHQRVQVLARALRDVVYRMGDVPPEIDTLGLIRDNIETKAQKMAELEVERKTAEERVAALSVPVST